MQKLILGRYTRQGLWSLFLMCALPLHAWTLILAFRDLSWLTDRTNAWDAVGVLCYGLVFAFIESAIVFLVTALLGLLSPRRWPPERRVGVLSILVLVLSLWAMVGQLFFLADFRMPGEIIAFLVRSQHPLRVIYAVLPAVVGATFLVPVVLVARSDRGTRIMSGIMDRLGLLSTFYLVFDAAAFVIVVIRNL
ncbi:MAG: hypothetical protein ACK2T0_04290 [Anaerolineales bacterium]